MKIHRGSDRIHQKCGTKDGQHTLKETKRCRAPATYFLYWWRGSRNCISKVIQTDSGKAKPNHTKPTNPNIQNKSSEQSPVSLTSLTLVAVSSKAEPFYPAVLLLKLEINNQLPYQSPWNWTDALGPFLTEQITEAESPSERKQNQATNSLSDQTNCLEEAEPAWAAWERFSQSEAPGRDTSHIELSAACAVCSWFSASWAVGFGDVTVFKSFLLL